MHLQFDDDLSQAQLLPRSDHIMLCCGETYVGLAEVLYGPQVWSAFG